jgi:hypothetical protein
MSGNVSKCIYEWKAACPKLAAGAAQEIALFAAWNSGDISEVELKETI